MKKLTRYVIIEAVGPFLAGIFFFTFVFVIQLLPELFKLIVQNDAPIWNSLEVFVYMLPFNIAITIPMSVLMASIMGYGRLSSDNEIIVMRALGFSHLRIYKPIIILGVMTFVFSFLFNNIVMSESNYRYRALIAYMINIRPSVAVDEMSFQTIPDMNVSIGAERVNKSNMFNVVIYDNGSANKAKRIITAEKGEWENNIANSRLITLKLYDGVVQELPDNGMISNDFAIFDTLDINIVRNVQSMIGGHERGLRELPSWKIAAQINQLKKSAKESINYQISNMITEAYTNTKETESIASFSNEYVATNSQNVETIIKKGMDNAVPYYYYVEFHKFISIPAACLFIVLVGAPLGIVGKRSGKGFGFGISVLVVVFYYLLITAAELIAGAKILNPFLAMWMPNIVLLVIGSFFMIRSFFTRGK